MKCLLSKTTVAFCITLIMSGCNSTSSGILNETDESNNGGTTISKPSPKDEPYYTYQWQFNSMNTSLPSLGYPVDPNADINIESSWDKTKGADIKVAVIDTGFDVYHEDLQKNIIDTYNADTGGSNVLYFGFGRAHGSTCAGFIAAPANGVGIVGVAPEAKLILIKEDSYQDANIIRAFEYAKSQGAKVISCSWGTGQVSQAVEAEFKSIYNSGITIVFASGNSGQDLDVDNIHDESESQWVIGIGSLAENNDVASYSDYGFNLDLISPGGDSSISSGLVGLDTTGFLGDDNQLGGIVNNNYAFVDGTSYACPIVSGTVALLLSINSNLTPAQIRTILITTTQKVGDTEYDINGFDVTKRRGYGKLDVGQALNKARGI